MSKLLSQFNCFTVAYEAVMVADGTQPRTALCWSVRILTCNQSICSFIFFAPGKLPYTRTGLVRNEPREHNQCAFFQVLKAF